MPFLRSRTSTFSLLKVPKNRRLRDESGAERYLPGRGIPIFWTSWGKESFFFLNYKYSWFKRNRHFRNDKGTGAEPVPHLFLGSHRSAIGQFFSLSLWTVPKVFAKVNSAQFPSSFTGEGKQSFPLHSAFCLFVRLISTCYWEGKREVAKRLYLLKRNWKILSRVSLRLKTTDIAHREGRKSSLNLQISTQTFRLLRSKSLFR